ncbi:MAG TPA: ribosome biogenesis GTP-binding protein YihA/YsxC [Candidatus Polarisedimenticolaceae bacterium]|nr:ribosome biogenesis GTP-binding protein YihA/YsxC [Candidatus Polarisedimenticolaceae bacterium]
MRVTECRFERATVRAEDEPKPATGDIVFLGRSNVGKSTLINRLLGAPGLARTSSTPGRTQTVNFYAVNGRHFFVDLPGYGYARAPASVRNTWGGMVEGFLTRRRKAIAAAVVLIDARRGVGELDRTMLGWLVDREIPVIVAGVKADKLGGNARTKAAKDLVAALPVEDGGVPPLLVSAVTGLGIPALWTEIDAALAAHAKDERWTSVS